MATFHSDGFYWSHSKFTYGSEEQHTNVRYITNFFRNQGWTDNAIAGILGNMQSESGINPGAYYGYKEFSSVSFGIVQWDPTSKYQTWHDDRYSGIIYEHLGCQLNRILYEMESGIQYYKTDEWPYTFREFSKSTLEAGTLAKVFVRNYERPASVLNGGTGKQNTYNDRAKQAEHWYTFITGIEGGGTVNPPSGGEAESNTTMYCIVNEGEYVNIRSGPGTTYSSIGRLHRGDAVYVVSITGNWAKINSPMEGYVMLTYLQNTHPDGSSPGIEGGTDSDFIMKYLTLYKGRHYRVVR